MPSNTVRVWRIMTHHEDAEASFRWFANNAFIALGWGRIGAINDEVADDAEALKDRVISRYGDPGRHAKGGKCLAMLASEMQIGDLVIVRAKRSLQAVVQITGGYRFLSTPPPSPIGDYQHVRPAQSTAIDADALWNAAGADCEIGQSIRWPLIACRARVLL